MFYVHGRRGYFCDHQTMEERVSHSCLLGDDDLID